MAWMPKKGERFRAHETGRKKESIGSPFVCLKAGKQYVEARDRDRNIRIFKTDIWLFEKVEIRRLKRWRRS